MPSNRKLALYVVSHLIDGIIKPSDAISLLDLDYYLTYCSISHTVYPAYIKVHFSDRIELRVL